MYPSLYNSVIPKMLSIAHGYERENESSLIVTDATQQIVNDFCRRSMGGKNKANAIEWFYFVPPRSVIFKWTIATHPRDETRFGFREYPLPVVFALFPALKSKPRTFHASADESSNFFSILLFFLFFFFCGNFCCANICLKDSYDPRCGVLKQQWLPFNGGFCTCFDPFRLRICLDPAGSVLTLLLVQKPIQPDPCGSEELEVDSSSRSGFGSC